MVLPPILCAGHTNWDVVIHADSVPDPDYSVPDPDYSVPDPDYSESITNDHMSCGGSATNTALALSSFGAEVGMVGSIGDDKYGNFVMDSLHENDVTPHLTIGNSPTTLIYAVITEGADPRYFAKNEELGGISIKNNVPEEKWNKYEHVHLTSFHEEYAGNIAKKASMDGKSVSFNPSQGYISRGPFPEVVEHSDVIFLNEREANKFRSWHNMGKIASEKTVVITHGSAGSTVYTSDGVFHHGGFNVSGEDLEDSIGAGDSFAAGFLARWLASESPEDSLELANAAGASSVLEVGAPDGLNCEWISQKIEQSVDDVIASISNS